MKDLAKHTITKQPVLGVNICDYSIALIFFAVRLRGVSPESELEPKIFAIRE